MKFKEAGKVEGGWKKKDNGQNRVYPDVLRYSILDKNGCNVDKIGHFPNCVDTTGHTQPGLFWRYMMLIPLSHSRSPAIRSCVKINMKVYQKGHPYERRRAKIKVFAG